MFRSLLFLLILLPGAICAQEKLHPFVDAPDTCLMIKEFAEHTDFEGMNGKIVTLGVNSARVPLHFDTDPVLDKIYQEEFFGESHYVIYSVFVYEDSVDINEETQARCYFANNNNFFSRAKNSYDRYYPIDISTKSGIKMLQAWAKTSNIYHFNGGATDISEWEWFRENAKFKIIVTRTIDGKQRVVFNRVLPKYFIEVLD